LGADGAVRAAGAGRGARAVRDGLSVSVRPGGGARHGRAADLLRGQEAVLPDERGARIQPHALVVLSAGRAGGACGARGAGRRGVVEPMRLGQTRSHEGGGTAMAQRIPLAALLALALVGVAQAQGSLEERLERLEAEVQRAEDVSALKRLQRAYGYYVDKGMWEDVADLFADDAVANYPAGVFIGMDSIRRHLYMNVGGGEMGRIGLGEGRLYNHMNIQPVVHLDPRG